MAAFARWRPVVSGRHRWLLTLLMLPLAACAAPPLRLYEGEARPAGAIAVVAMPEQLEVAQLNGVEVPGAKGLWRRGEQQLQLLPRHYELLVFYREFWDVGSQEQILRSDPVRLVVDAAAGEHYRIDYTRPRNVREAQRLQADFHAWIEDAHGRREASIASGLMFRRDWAAALGNGDALVAQQTAAASPPAAPALAPVSDDIVPALPHLQAWWQQASAQERRAFLQWIAVHPQ